VLSPVSIEKEELPPDKSRAGQEVPPVGYTWAIHKRLTIHNMYTNNNDPLVLKVFFGPYTPKLFCERGVCCSSGQSVADVWATSYIFVTAYHASRQVVLMFHDHCSRLQVYFYGLLPFAVNTS